MNLFRPYQAMKQIWKASRNPLHWTGEPDSALVGCWWGLWIVCGLLGQASFRMEANVHDPGTLNESTIVTILSSLVAIPLDLVAIAMIKAIYRNQKALVETH
jgi:hypothetical protein